MQRTSKGEKSSRESSGNQVIVHIGFSTLLSRKTEMSVQRSKQRPFRGESTKGTTYLLKDTFSTRPQNTECGKVLTVGPTTLGDRLGAIPNLSPHLSTRSVLLLVDFSVIE
jgi:hypothetical protein